jgi:hypothetical protein
VADQKPRKRLTVLGLDVEYEGISKRNNQPYTIYNVTALGEDGLPIEERLRTFDGELPLNELIEVEVEKRPDERHGTTYTLSIPGKRSGGGGGGGGLAGSVDALRERVDALEARLAALENPQLQSAATPPPGSPTTF